MPGTSEARVPGARSDAQRRFVLCAGSGIEQPVSTAELSRLLDAEQRLEKIVPVSVMLKKNRSAVIYEFTLEAPSGTGQDGGGAAVNPPPSRPGVAYERRKVLDAPDVVLLRLL